MSLVEHAAFVLTVLPLADATLGVRCLRQMCMDNLRRHSRSVLAEVCIGLASLALPAYLVCIIARHTDACAFLAIPLERRWRVAVRVKHFRPRLVTGT